MGQPMAFVYIVSFLSYNIIPDNSPDWQDIERYGRAEIKSGGMAAAILDSNLNVVDAAHAPRRLKQQNDKFSSAFDKLGLILLCFCERILLL